MKRFVLVSLMIGCVWTGSRALAQKAGEIEFDPKTTVAVSAAGTLGSRDIFSGLAPGRHLVAVSSDLDVTVHESRKMRYRWEFEVLPLIEVSDPHDVQIVTLNLYTGQSTTLYYDSLDLLPCTSKTYTDPYYAMETPGTLTQVGTYTVVQKCSTVWTYSGGLSPLGQRVNFRPRHRLQPYGEANAGFLAATRKLPISTATQFNFTAEGGAGIEFFQSAKRSFALDVRYHHTSNGGRGQYNPGIDNVMFKLSYRMGL